MILIIWIFLSGLLLPLVGPSPCFSRCGRLLDGTLYQWRREKIVSNSWNQILWSVFLDSSRYLCKNMWFCRGFSLLFDKICCSCYEFARSIKFLWLFVAKNSILAESRKNWAFFSFSLEFRVLARKLTGSVPRHHVVCCLRYSSAILKHSVRKLTGTFLSSHSVRGARSS